MTITIISDAPLVSVVVPAFNAAATIARTLASARAQSWQSLEIIVVDDGSSDATPEILREIARKDPRVRFIQQENAGVAAARNTGLAASEGTFVAYLDADDLWTPGKLQAQIAALESNPEAGLAYAWFRRIDESDRVLPPSPHPRVEGSVLHRHLAWNFVANGSALLVRGSLARRIGFDATLRTGCEDYLHQLEIALETQFVCVPQFMVGYRRSKGSLSAARLAMERAHLAMFDRIEPRLPASARQVLAQRRAEMHARLTRGYLRKGRFGRALEEATLALRADAREALRNTHQAWALRGEKASPFGRPPLFFETKPSDPDGSWRTRQDPARLEWLKSLDAC